jgi:hypothetical protein
MYVFTIIDKLVKLVEVYKTVVRSILIYANETKVNMRFTKKKENNRNEKNVRSHAKRQKHQ